VSITRITDQTTRPELEKTIALLNEVAKDLSRRGKVGTLTDEYATMHGRIDAVLRTWETTPRCS
jgi:hypothetical protein